MDHVAPNLNLPADWDRLIEAVGPAALLVTIDQRLSAALKSRFSPEDILQEALLHAWRDRAQLEWRGLRSFRGWLLTIIDNRIRDLAAYAGAQKRANAAEITAPPRTDSNDSQTSFLAGLTSTTPSRIAIRREQAAAMQAALADLPDDQRDVVRLRLFDHLSMEDIAARLQIGLSAARHRFRAGAVEYYARLSSALASHPSSEPAPRVEFAPES